MYKNNVRIIIENVPVYKIVQKISLFFYYIEKAYLCYIKILYLRLNLHFLSKYCKTTHDMLQYMR